MRSNEIDSVIIDRYLAGELSDQESQEIEEWLARFPIERNKLFGIRSKAAERFGPVPSYDVDARVASIVDFSKRSARRIHEEAGAYRILVNGNSPVTSAYSSSERQADFDSGQVRNSWRSRSFYVAVTCVLAVCAVALGIIGDWGPSSKSGTESFAVYATNAGEQATITLPDSSKVVLNVASRLEVPVDYGKKNRTLRLRGEAFFTVTQAQGNPFTVIAGPSTTRVLGTRFSVRHYPADSNATVAVQDGKVSVQSTTLTALQQASVSHDGQAYVSNASVGRFAFSKGVLNLEDQPLINAIDDLNRWYNVDIRLGSSDLKRISIFGEFEAGSITDLIEILRLTLNVSVERNGRILTLYLRD